MLGGLGETILVLGVTFTIMAAFVPAEQEMADTIESSIAASELRQVRDAANPYIKDNWSTIYAAAATPTVITVDKLITAGYLPNSSGGANPWQQNHAILVMQSGTSGLIGAVVTYGGNQVPTNRIITAAALIGDYAAYAPYSTDPAACAGPCIKGIGTNWTQSLTAFASTPATAAYVPTSGHLAAGIFFNGGQMACPFLARFYNAGDADCNVMHTAINMNGNAINNVTSIGITNGTSTQTLNYADASMINALFNGTYPSSTASGGNLTVTGSQTVDVNQVVGGSQSVYGNVGINGTLSVNNNIWTGGSIGVTGNSWNGGYVYAGGPLITSQGAQLGAVATEGWGCGPNGTIAASTDGSGTVYSCTNGAWSRLGGASTVVMSNCYLEPGNRIYGQSGTYINGGDWVLAGYYSGGGDFGNGDGFVWCEAKLQ